MRMTMMPMPVMPPTAEDQHRKKRDGQEGKEEMMRVRMKSVEAIVNVMPDEERHHPGDQKADNRQPEQNMPGEMPAPVVMAPASPTMRLGFVCL
jgi:hypothetical protein